jgi:8-oxo-dGTP pyrophosphatase MutT (NUDIX family)
LVLVAQIGAARRSARDDDGDDMTDTLPIRKSARLVVLNARDEVFLLDSHGLIPSDPKHAHILHYWITPGGAVEPGETWEEAALRELWEETGIEGVPLGPWVWSRQKDGIIFGEPTRSVQRYYLVRVGKVEVHGRNRLPHEAEGYRQHRWWPLDEIRVSEEVFFPEGLADLLKPLLAGDIPPEPVMLTV